MKSWHPLSGTFTAPNGLEVEPVATETALKDLGTHFRNGLSVHHDTWASLCQRGKRQIFCVRDGEGDLLANGELEVKDGRVRPMFVRGHRNEEFGPGSAEFEAALRYVAAVNTKELDLNLVVGQDGFVAAPGMLSIWDQAVKTANEQGISPLSALLNNQDTPVIDPDADPIQEKAWTPLTGPYKHENGYTVEPIGTRGGLRTLGEELENNLFIAQAHGYTADLCTSGATQFAAIYNEADGIVAMAEFRPTEGRIAAAACRGRFDGEAWSGVQVAVAAYVEAVNERRIETAVAIGNNGFAVEGAEAETDIDPDEPVCMGPTLGLSQRTNDIAYDNDGDYEDDFDDADGDYDADDEDEDEDDLYVNGPPSLPIEDPVTWTALSERFVAGNGLVVEPVTDQETLRQMGVEFDNALKTLHARWAHMAQKGEVQVLRVLDADGQLVANAEMAVEDKAVKANFVRCRNNASGPVEAEAAVEQWCAAVNERTIDLNGSIEDGRFVFEEPRATPGM